MSDVNDTTLPEGGASDTSPADPSDAIGPAAREQLKAFVARIERVQEEIDNAKADQKEIYAEAKSMGYDTKILRKVISLRKIDRRERQEADALTELYLGCVEG